MSDMMGNGDTGAERTVVVRTGTGLGLFGSFVVLLVGLAGGLWLLPNIDIFNDLAQGLRRIASVGSAGVRGDQCAENSLACLRQRQRELSSAEQRLEDALVELRPASDTIASLILANEARYAQNELLLAEGRSVMQRVSDQAAPVRFVGTSYPDRATFVRQMEVLWREREAMEQILTNARSQRVALQQRYDAILVAQNEVRSAVALLPAQLELGRANDAMTTTSATLRAIDRAVQRGDASPGDLEAVIRTTDELMRAHGARRERDTRSSPQGLEAFLHRPS